jgi:cell filamentation protein
MGIFDDFGKRNPATGEISWFVSGIDIPVEAKKLFVEIREKDYFRNMQLFEFVKEISNFFGKLNTLHPFREGNGRTQRIFTELLAEKAGYKLDLETNIDKQTMIDACNYSMSGDNRKMFVIFFKSCKPTNQPPKKTELKDKTIFFVENEDAATDENIYKKRFR